jgi:hypothetical protein
MNESHTNAVLAALEGQRNTALNNLVNVQAALTITQARVKELEQKVAEVSIQPELPPFKVGAA